MEEKKVKETEMEDRIGFQLSGLSKIALKHDQKKFERKQKKAQKKADWDALSDEEKHAAKKAKALKIGAAIGGGVAVAGAAAVAALKIAGGQRTDDLVEIEEVSVEEIPETVETEYPAE